MNDLQKRTWAEINLENLRHNYRAIRATLPDGCRFLGVVKADAYGHGALPVSRLLQAEGADYLAVSCLDEALELRGGGVTMPILILGHTPHEYTSVLIEQNITQTVTCLAKALEYSAEAVSLGKTLKIHIQLDTGMSRLGFLCDGAHFEEGVDNVIRSCTLPGIESEGVYTHFAVSDEPGEDCEKYTRDQFALFCRVVDEVETRGNIKFKIRHCANSGAVESYPEMALDMVRPGLLLYGYGDTSGRMGLKPCMRLVSTVSTIKIYDSGVSVSYGRRYVTERRTRMGVLAIGYADGLPRVISNKCSFAAGNGFAPQRGSICMDMCMIDLTELPEVDVGSEVELFGERNSIYKLSDAAGTIPYELLCAVSNKRRPRERKVHGDGVLLFFRVPRQNDEGRFMPHGGDELVQHVAHCDAQSGGVYTGVAAEIFVGEQVVIYKQVYAALSVVHQPQYADGAGRDIQKCLHVLRGRERQPRRAYLL